ncbi:fasciclin domain-containing protein [Phycicoccus sp. Root101]|uniref:fasciclin domain-containing protein n=1 Tax=Phycicoccus sp. Root101 TaxID=1736421 RepID=UPI0007028059|nr:fasciclin domain-containing protein [Phycicoccus sp. Root101]KQU70865.1 fasciclin [Phycicoccus sp. Root101]
MYLRRRVSSVLATAALATALVAPAASAAPTTTASTGTRSLAAVLTADGNTFDRNWYDYDILTEAVLAVLAAKPDSPVGVLADGTVPLTAFLPNDRAFQVLVADLTRSWPRTEQKTFSTLASTVGIDAIEKVLLYHVVPGVTIDSRTALRSDGASLPTALPGASFTVDVLSARFKLVVLRDNDKNDVNPILNPRALDINKGNRQIAHGIVFVLRPVDL